MVLVKWKNSLGANVANKANSADPIPLRSYGRSATSVG